VKKKYKNGSTHLNTAYEREVGYEGFEDNAQHAAQAKLRDARTDPLQAEHHLDRKARP
jgi:hypothetical protein